MSYLESLASEYNSILGIFIDSTFVPDKSVTVKIIVNLGQRGMKSFFDILLFILIISIAFMSIKNCFIVHSHFYREFFDNIPY